MVARHPPGTTALLTCLTGVGYFYANKLGANLLIQWTLIGMIAIQMILILKELHLLFVLEGLERRVKQPSGLLGRLQFPEAQDADKLGLKFSNPDGNGIPVGGVNRTIIYYDGPGHISIRAPTNAAFTAKRHWDSR
jgi:hypothetical protein